MAFLKTKFVAIGFYLLFLLVPLSLFPTTSEIFEFNKIIITYALTVFILASWTTRMVTAKKIIFRRSILDVPILLFLASQVASSYLSIDPRTSLFGYYSRFNGGLTSLFSYAILYWAYVSNMTAKESKNSLIALLASSYIVSVYAFLQRLGVDRSVWDQNVQERVFSTFGQPNWLAAWIVAIIPLTWAYTIFNFQFSISNLKNKRFLLSLGIFILLFLTLLFTKSRSGLLGFLTAYASFWGILFLIKKGEKKVIKVFALITSTILLASLVVGTALTPSFRELTVKKSAVRSQSVAGEGGTESGKIRKIVWKGAIDIWRAYPIFGTGVETFAFAYPTFRPAEHNLVSEWEFIYNKAHNEYLNYLATTGTIGFTTYLLLVIAIGYLFFRNLQFSISNFQINPNLKINKFRNSLKIENWSLLILGLASGWASILVTNLFSFSTVTTSILFFLYPAIALQLTSFAQDKLENKPTKVFSLFQKILTVFLLIVTSYLLIVIFRYWYADYLYARARAENDAGNYTQGGEIMLKAIKLSRGEAIYYDELASSSAGIAVQVSEANDTANAEKYAQQAIALSENAIKLSPRNITLRKHLAGLYIKLTAIDTSYLYSARDTMAEIAPLAPTDAKLFYNLGLTLARTGEVDQAIQILKRAVDLKPDFRDARFTIALLEIDNDNMDEARVQLEYILNNIDPDDILVSQQLEELGL